MSNQTKPAPPKIVVAPEGCESYLTAGKEYIIEITFSINPTYGWLFTLTNDINQEIFASEFLCTHLNYKDWIIKEREVSHD